MYLVLSSRTPIRNARGIGNSFLEAMRTEGAEGDGGGAVEAADCVEGDGHGGLLGLDVM